MATPQNLYLLNLARCCESVAQGERNQILYPHDRIEVLASCLQALLQTLGGGQPTTTAMPPDIAMGLSDLVQTAGQKPNLAWQAFVPSFPFGTLQVGVATSVLVDGSVNAVTYASSFAFPTATLGVIAVPENNYPSNPWILSPQTFGYSTTGFNLYCPGGPTGQSVSCPYLAWGN